MIRFANAQDAPAVRTNYATKVGFVYAVVLILMTIGQLYAFEKFIPLIADYWLPGGHGTATLVAGIIVITEVFSLPYLLRMRVSPLMRWLGLVCSILVPLIWFVLSLVAISQTIAITNSGMLGAKVNVHAGLLQLVVTVAVAALAATSAHGLWPRHKK
jgi:hypothetical protein